jgi:hypothetical protein
MTSQSGSEYLKFSDTMPRQSNGNLSTAMLKNMRETKIKNGQAGKTVG